MKTETKTGKTVATASAGTSTDTAMNAPGFQANPDVDTQMRAPRDFPAGQYSKVCLSLGLTKNLGDFEFARIDVGIEEFCDPTLEARTETFTALQAEAKVILANLTKRIASRSGGPLNG